MRSRLKLPDLLNRKGRVVFRDFLDRAAESGICNDLIGEDAGALHDRLARDFAGDRFNQITSCPVHCKPQITAWHISSGKFNGLGIV